MAPTRLDLKVPGTEFPIPDILTDGQSISKTVVPVLEVAITALCDSDLNRKGYQTLKTLVDIQEARPEFQANS